MKESVAVCLGIFSVMALSNAIVPVLPEYSSRTVVQGAIYSAYFFGAFIMALPGGLLSDRYGRTIVMQSGLVVTIFSGIVLWAFPFPSIIVAARCAEGIGAGLFVAAALAYVNSRSDHMKMSGYFMAALNLGLVIGLVTGGILAVQIHIPSAGILLFTITTGMSGILGTSYNESPQNPEQDPRPFLASLLLQFRWFWYSCLVLIGITGVVSALYPGYSGIPPDMVGIWIAGMSVATIISVILITRFNLLPIPTIRISAIMMCFGMLLSFVSPAGFLVIGATAGVVMVAQMAFLAQVTGHQGTAIGLFSATSYLGMSLLPFVAGVIAEATTFSLAFGVIACVALSVAVTIGRCECRNQLPVQKNATAHQ